MAARITCVLTRCCSGVVGLATRCSPAKHCVCIRETAVLFLPRSAANGEEPKQAGEAVNRSKRECELIFLTLCMG